MLSFIDFLKLFHAFKKKDIFLDKTDNLFYLQSQSDQIVTSKVKSNTVF